MMVVPVVLAAVTPIGVRVGSDPATSIVIAAGSLWWRKLNLILNVMTAPLHGLLRHRLGSHPIDSVNLIYVRRPARGALGAVNNLRLNTFVGMLRVPFVILLILVLVFLIVVLSKARQG